MKPEIHLIGAGGLASDFIACFKNHFEIKGCWDDNLEKDDLFMEIPVMGTVDELFRDSKVFNVIITIANPQVRNKIFSRLQYSNHISPVIIHPDSKLFDTGSIEIGNGAVVFPGAFITTKVIVGNHVIIHIGTSIHHDVTIGNCSVLMPGVRLTGNVTIGKNVFLGPGETITHGISIKDNELVTRL